MPFIAAVRAAILADEKIPTQLAKFDQGDGEAAAVFTGPRDLQAPAPCIEIHLDGGTPEESFDDRGAEQQITISVFGPRNGTNRQIRRIAEDIQWLLDRATLTVSGFADPIVHASVPQYIEDDWPRYDLTATISAFKED